MEEEIIYLSIPYLVAKMIQKIYINAYSGIRQNKFKTTMKIKERENKVRQIR